MFLPVPSRSRGVPTRASAALVVFAVAWLVAMPAASQDPSEYRLKAAFVKTFPRFVSWPPSALKSRRTFEICIASPDPFGTALRELVEGETIDEPALRELIRAAIALNAGKQKPAKQ